MCPVRNLKNWIAATTRQQGPLFEHIRKSNTLTGQRLSDRSVDLLLKRYLGGNYSAHSLRASFITIAKLNGADDSEIMHQTKHKTSTMIQRYTRIDSIKKHNAAKKLGI